MAEGKRKYFINLGDFKYRWSTELRRINLISKLKMEKKFMSKLFIIMYHYIRDLKHSRYPNIKGLDVNLFRQQINFLKKNFKIVSMEQVIDAFEKGGELPENAVLLTFDDGYLDHYTYVFPILEEERVQGSFFIPGKTFSTHELLDVNKVHYILASANVERLLQDVFERMNFYRGSEFDFPSNEELFAEFAEANRFDTRETIFVKRILQTALPEKLRNRISSDLFEKYVGVSEEKLAYELYMTEEQIRTLKRNGMFIGIHGYDHYWLGNLGVEQMRADVSKALEVMDEFIDSAHWVMNYPYGSYNSEVLRYIGECGACLGMTTEVAVTDIGRLLSIPDGRYLLPRFDCNDFPPKSENYYEIRKKGLL